MNDDQKYTEKTHKTSFLPGFGEKNFKSLLADAGKVLTSSPAKSADEDGEEKKQIAKRGAYICMFFALGLFFSFARLPFGTYPFAIALVGCASSHVIVSALGMICGITLFKLPVSHFLALAILLLVRILGRVLLDKPEYRIKSDLYSFIRYDLFAENIYLRLSAVSVAIFSVGLWNIIANNFRYYDLWGALIGMIAAPVFAYPFSLFFDSENQSARSISASLFLVCTTFALKGAENMGLFLAVSLSFIAVITLARRSIAIHVLALSLILGIVCGIEYTPIFFTATLVYVCINYFGKPREGVALLLSLGSGIALSFLTCGRAAIYTVFPAALAATAADNLIRACMPGINICEEFTSAKTKQALIINAETEERLEKMSESFGKLSRSFKRLSDRLSHPGIYEIRKECDDAIEKYCSDCKHCTLCWGDNYNSTIGFLANISKHLAAHGKIDSSFIPKEMSDICSNTDRIIEDINEKTKHLYKDTLEKEKLTVFSADYFALSKVINDSIKEKQNENSENKELTEKALEAMGKYKNDFHTVSIWGKRKLRVFARLKTLNENTVGMREFKRIMEEVCECRFSNPTLKVEGKSMTVTLNIKPIFKAKASSSRISADERYMCGDTPSHFDGHDNYFYAIISDGMGTGPSAALTSGICEVFLREMLEGGNRVDTSLNMLNAVLTSKNDECSATVDIMELDLYSGRASFIKSGAASSFILRDGNVYRLSSRTMPLGILEEIDADMQKVRLCDGDTVFLVSDGNAPMDNYENLINIIKSTLPAEPLEAVSERIVANSKKISKDDISCVVVRISNL